MNRISIESGLLRGRVISQARTYRVMIYTALLSISERETITNLIASKAYYTACLLNNELPEPLAALLNPSSDLQISCSCGKGDTRCEHAEAVLSAAHERMAREPLLLLQWRGLPQADLFAALRRMRCESWQSSGRKNIGEPLLDRSMSTFLSDGTDENATDRDASILDLADRPPFWSKEITLQQLFAPLYHTVAERAEQLRKRIEGNYEQ